MGLWEIVCDVSEEEGQGTDAGVMGPVACYSCMSLSYQNTWGVLRHVYRRPHSFTDKCNDPFLGKAAVGTINCSNICVVLKEPQFSAGLPFPLSPPSSGRRREWAV